MTGDPLRPRLEDWSRRLADAGVPSPAADAQALAGHILGVGRAQLALIESIEDPDVSRVDRLVLRRQAREPLQHILGSAPFLDLELAVGPGVFVPRPETEMMADFVIQWLLQQRSTGKGLLRPGPRTAGGTGPLRVVDLCSGSGALTLAIACHVPGSVVTGVEVSQSALAFARQNLASLSDRIDAVGSRAAFVRGDVAQPPGSLLAASFGAVDVVVANPPYIPDHCIPREPEVRDFDPAVALFGGSDGFDTVRPILDLAARLLRPGALLAIEHADDQGGLDGGLPGLIARHGRATAPTFGHVEDHADLAGRPRYTTAVGLRSRF